MLPSIACIAQGTRHTPTHSPKTSPIRVTAERKPYVNMFRVVNDKDIVPKVHTNPRTMCISVCMT